MTDYGVTDTGFVKKTFDIIKSEIQDDLRDEVNAKLNLLDSSVMGQIVGIFSDKLREMWDVQEAVYRAFYPDSASGASLDDVASLTGAIRLAATKSDVILDRLYLDNGTTIPVGSIVRVGEFGNQFVTTAAVTNSTGYAATLSTTAEAITTGPLDGPAEEIDTIVTPISGWSDKPAVTNTSTASTYNLDGTSLTMGNDESPVPKVVSFSGGDPWTATDVANEINSKQGPYVTASAVGTKIRISTNASQGSIRIIAGGSNTVLQFPTDLIKGFNSVEANVGRDLELDPAFRLRREQLLRIAGSATVEAIRSAILDLSGVVQCLVIENFSNMIDANGLPPKSFEAIVQQVTWSSAEEQAVGEAIWENKPAGIESFGSTSVSVEDSMGFSHDIYFSKPTGIPIYIKLSLTTNEDFPSNGEDLVIAALKSFGDTTQVGENIIALQYKCVPLEVAGVEDVPTFFIDTVSPPTGTTNIAIGVREIGTFDISQIQIV